MFFGFLTSYESAKNCENNYQSKNAKENIFPFYVFAQDNP